MFKIEGEKERLNGSILIENYRLKNNDIKSIFKLSIKY